MTRETKIGLVVASSFLCLVTIVVASKWKRGDGAPADPEEQTVKVAAAKPGQNAGDPKANDTPQRNDASPSFPSGLAPLPEKKDTPLTGGPPPLTSIPPAAPFGDPSKDIPMPKPFEFKPSDMAIVPPPVQAEFKPPVPSPFAQEEKRPIVVAPLDPTKFGALATLEPLPKKEEPKRQAISFGVVPVEVKNQENAIPPLTEKAVPLVFSPMPKDGLVEIPPPKKDLNPPSVVLNPKDITRPMNPNDTSTVPPIVNSQGKTAIIPSNPSDGPSMPPIIVGGFKPPMLNRYDPEFTELRFGEASFGQLSQRLYGTAKYGDALHAYNRDHRDLIKFGANVAANPPVLNAGQQVMYPPKELLERDYRALIREASVVPAAPIPPPIVSISPPTVLNPGVGALAPAPINRTGIYIVQEQGGERIRDIARRFLGNPDHWMEIYRLNPKVEPRFPIPAGTQLNLPSN